MPRWPRLLRRAGVLALGFLAMLFCGQRPGGRRPPPPLRPALRAGAVLRGGPGGPRQRLARHRPAPDARSRERSSRGSGSDGVREVLFPQERYRAQIDTPAGKPLSAGSVADPNVSFDGQWVLFTWYHDLTSVNPQRGDNGGPYLSRPGPTSTSCTWARASWSASPPRRSPRTPATAPASSPATRAATTPGSACSTPAAPGLRAAGSSSPRSATISSRPRPSTAASG